MIFKGKGDTSLEFLITGYEFPDTMTNKYDLNWFIIQTKFNHGLTILKYSDPSLTTFEVQEIIDWFYDLSNDVISNKGLTFVEPYWEFHLLGTTEEIKTIQIITEVVAPLEVEMDLTNLELNGVAKELEKELEKFPIRYLEKNDF